MGITQQSAAARLIQPGVCTSSTRPASPFEGQAIFETDTDRMLIWNGTTWVIPNQTTTNPTGLELIKTQTVGSGVSSAVVSNVFSTTYDNYKILYSGGVLSVGTHIALQLGPSTVANYNASYETSLNYASSSTSLFAYSGIVDRFEWVGGGNGSMAQLGCELYGPNLPRFTRMALGSYHSTNAMGNSYGTHREIGQYTDFTLFVNGGTMTGGTIAVYGYRK